MLARPRGYIVHPRLHHPHRAPPKTFRATKNPGPEALGQKLRSGNSEPLAWNAAVRLLPSGLYRRLRSFTGSCARAPTIACGLYRRSGLGHHSSTASPNPEGSSTVFTLPMRAMAVKTASPANRPVRQTSDALVLPTYCHSEQARNLPRSEAIAVTVAQRTGCAVSSGAGMSRCRSMDRPRRTVLCGRGRSKHRSAAAALRRPGDRATQRSGQTTQHDREAQPLARSEGLTNPGRHP